MLITKTPTQLSHLLDSARSLVNSTISSIIDGVESVFLGNLIGREQPDMALIPVSHNHRGNPCGRVVPAIDGTNANIAVRMYADPVTKEWRVLDFGKTKTGMTGHSQPSRFAP